MALYFGLFWLAVPLVLTASHLMHGLLIGFHEASHGLLRKTRRLNEIDGIIIGIFSLMSFSLYRAAHQLHHAYLATERDEELWPFVIPGTPRWARVLAAILELSLGLFFTPFLFVRTFLRAGSPIRNQKLRRRVWAEFASDRRSLVLPAGSGGLVGSLEIFSLDVSGACVSGLEHAELAQIHRACRSHRFHRQQLDPKHCVRGSARPSGCFHSAP